MGSLEQLQMLPNKFELNFEKMSVGYILALRLSLRLRVQERERWEYTAELLGLSTWA